MKNLLIRFISTSALTLLLMLAGQTTALAQCAMCRGTVENNAVTGDISMAAGLNTGILYLFFAPYVILSVVGYFWYKKSKANARKKKIRRHFQV